VEMSKHKGHLKKILSGVDEDIYKFIKGLIKFNPERRKPVDELLADSLFAEIRSPTNECLGTKEIDIAIDRLPVNESNGKIEDYSEKKMKEYIIKLL